MASRPPERAGSAYCAVHGQQGAGNRRRVIAGQITRQRRHLLDSHQRLGRLPRTLATVTTLH